MKEGKATILIPQGAKIGEDRNEVQQVFYNPIQQYNRDLSVLAIKTYGEQALKKRRDNPEPKNGRQHGRKRKRADGDGDGNNIATKVAGEVQNTAQTSEHTEASEESTAPKPVGQTFKIFDALSASGLRALRYAHELPFLTSVNANDLSESAADTIRSNVDHNGLGHIISVTNDDALAYMYRSIAADLSRRDRYGMASKANKFDVVDLDPYGSAATFFDAAVQAVRDDGGLLCITCTDAAVWAGHCYSEKSFALYGGTPLKGPHSHEAGLRLILNGVATSAARYGLAIEPLLSLSIDFYGKLFIRITRSPNAVKFLGAKTMLVYGCDQGCGAWQTQPLMKSKQVSQKTGKGFFYKHTMAAGPTDDKHCQYCGFTMHVSGPMYGGHIHSSEFIQQMLDEIPNADPEVYGTLPRLEGMLRTALEEHFSGPEDEEALKSKDARLAVVDPCPFFVVPSKLSGTLSCSSPPDDMFRGALKYLGYRVRRSHCRPGSVKTDAPWSTIWWVMTEYIRQKAPIKQSKFKPTMAPWKILHEAGLVGCEDQDGKNASSASDVDMTSTEQAIEDKAESSERKNGTQENNGEVPSESELRKTLVFNDELARLGRHPAGQRYVRYQANPVANWGPMTKASRS